ncbi:unnamed protein product [Brassica rapa subsp. trilocularis]
MKGKFCLIVSLLILFGGFIIRSFNSIIPVSRKKYSRHDSHSKDNEDRSTSE